MKAVGVALLGTGMWARRLAAAVRRTPSLELVTCFAPNAEKRAAFARDFGCGAATSLGAAIEDDRVDGVLVVTPNSFHADHAIACAERGRHVFLEKPIADTLADGLAIRSACEAAGVTLLVGHGFRRLGAARASERLVVDGSLGRVVLAEANFSLPGTLTPETWRFYRATCPGGPLLQLGVHHGETLLHWLGSAERVRGSFARLATPAEIDDVAVALVDHETGARSTIAASYVSPKTFAIRLLGTEGVLDYVTDMSIWPNAERMDEATQLTVTTREGKTEIGFEPRDMLVEELEEFAGCVRGETEPETGADEALAALALVLAAIESYEGGEPVSPAALARA
ncbi:MAG: Gfo/Idh/MocA family oxidoreductase [Actinomycetota bacterium]|nr:Gfo/Idh/MocA family oxidoreductase [Actinomycetota bacterium]